jgi:hypothetical protein
MDGRANLTCRSLMPRASEKFPIRDNFSREGQSRVTHTVARRGLARSGRAWWHASNLADSEPSEGVQ